jgi:hypothetical protein
MVVGCQPYAPAVFSPRKYSWCSFLLEAESTPGALCYRKDFMLTKNPQTPAGIEPATFRFVARHLNHWPQLWVSIILMMTSATLTRIECWCGSFQNCEELYPCLAVCRSLLLMFCVKLTLRRKFLLSLRIATTWSFWLYFRAPTNANYHMTLTAGRMHARSVAYEVCSE